MKTATVQNVSPVPAEHALVAALSQDATPPRISRILSRIRGYIARHGFRRDSGGDDLGVIAAIARDLDGGSIAEANRDLERLDAELSAYREASGGLVAGAGRRMWPTDVAGERWVPEIRAAYYFGLALGLAVGSNGFTADAGPACDRPRGGRRSGYESLTAYDRSLVDDMVRQLRAAPRSSRQSPVKRSITAGRAKAARS
jgi:hypothetical protein